MDPKLFAPLMLGAFILFAIYRRVRRNVGRQPVQPMRMRSRIMILSVVGGLLALSATRDVNLIGAMLAGVAGGAALGWFGLRHTQFEKTTKGAFYTPHTYIGLAVSLLLIGRIGYRLLVVLPSMQASAQADPNALPAFQRSPLTLAIFGVLIGYYIFYYAGVLRTSQALAPTDLPALPTPPAADS